MNVLVDGVTPRVVSLAEALQQWLDHRRDVLVRRSRHRLEAIERRLEMLAGMIVVFLNLDEVIRIIREEDEPKEALKARFALTEDAGQLCPRHPPAFAAPARGNGAAQGAARTSQGEGLDRGAAARANKKQWQTIAYEIRDIKKKFGARDGARAAAHSSKPRPKSSSPISPRR